jgi:putative hydrolase of the HAD superfamily
MNGIDAIGFDLFNTLVTVERPCLGEAVGRLLHSLREGGLPVEDQAFKQAHKEAAIRFFGLAQKEGRETHNRFWISAALESLGYDVPPDDPRISAAVDAYFSAFFDYGRLIPGTLEMLTAVQGKYRLGLLSNFTHAPAAMRLLDLMGLAPFFSTVVISGAVGYRKPHPLVFERLVEGLGVQPGRVLFIGDDPEPDIQGAAQAGLQPIWTTYVADNHIPASVGAVYSPGTEVPEGTPRISNWHDLFALLG